MTKHQTIIQLKLNIRWSLHFKLLLTSFIFCCGTVYAQNLDSIPYTIDVDTFLDNLNDGYESDSQLEFGNNVNPNFYFKKRKEAVGESKIIWKTLVVRNQTSSKLKGEIRVFSSSGFLKPLDSGDITINLSPASDTTLTIPFIIDFKSVDGGKTTTVQAIFFPVNTLSNIEIDLQAVSFVKIKKSGSWLIKSELVNPVWMSYEIEKNINLYLVNNSNFSRVFQIDVLGSQHQQFGMNRVIELTRYSDTTIRIPITRPISNEMGDNRFLVRVKNETVTKENRIYTSLYENSYKATSLYSTSPLNIELGAFNFGGTGNLGYSLKTWGNLNFSKNESVGYSLLAYNINNRSDIADIWRFSRMSVIYQRDNSVFRIGDESIGGDFYREFGRGIQVKTDLFTGKDFSIDFGVVKNLFLNKYSYSSKGQIKYNNIRIQPAIIYSNDQTNLVDKFDASISIATNIKSHNLSFGLSRSLRNNIYDSSDFESVRNVFLPDTSISGWAVNAMYDISIRGWNIRARSLSRTRYHAGAPNGQLNQNLTLSKDIRKNNSISLLYNRRKNSASESFFGRLINTNYLDISRSYLNYNYKIFNTHVTTGVHYYYTELTTEFNQTSGNPLNLKYYASPRVITRISGKVDNVRLTAFFQSGYTFFNNPTLSQINERGDLTQVGINIQNKNESTVTFRLNKGIFSPSPLGLNYLTLSNSSSFYAGYRLNKRVFNEQLLLNFNANYVNYTEAKVSIASCFLNSTLSLDHGLFFTTFLNLSSYSSNLEDRVSKSVFTNAGISLRKEFGFDQPALSYRDLAINVFFDENGNRMKDSSEIFISDVLIKIEGDNETIHQISGVSITDSKGSVFFENIPLGNYSVSFNPMGKSNINITETNLLFVHTEEKEISVPLTEKCIIEGRIILNKARFSKITSFNYNLLTLKVTNPLGEVRYIEVNGNGTFRRQLTKIEGLYKVELLTDKIPGFLVPENRISYIDIDGFKSYQINFNINEAKPAMIIIDK